MRYAAIVALTVFASTPVFAADMAVKAPPPPPPPAWTWTGFYVGGHAGYGWGHMTIDNFGAGGVPIYSFNFNGFVGGGQAGYNWQIGQFVLGVEGDISAKNFKGNDGGAFGALDSIDGKSGATIRGRAGIAFGRFLVYATGGGAWLNYNYTSFITPAGPGVTFSNTDFGWTAGGGFEYAFWEKWSAKVEYLYANYGTDNRAATIFANPWSTSIKTNEVRGGINFHF
jgi:outer membrane immunogenic protein